VRINIYQPEIDGTVSIVRKTTDEGTFTGVRVHLKSPASLMAIDRESAVTFWGNPTDLRRFLFAALDKLENHEIAPREVKA